MSTTLLVYTLLHVAISLVAIAAGFVVLYGLLTAKQFDGWTRFFLATTVATSVTGFGFPVEGLLPSHVLGIISLVVLAIAIAARSRYHLAGRWRAVFVITSVAALYLNVFVLVVQSFLKVPALHELAPNQTEAPFAVAQLGVLLVFVVAGVMAVARFKPAA